MIRLSEQARGRWSAASRIAAVTLGAYATTALATVVLSLLLARIGMSRAEAVVAATLASFAVFAVIAMALFHARSVTRAWAWLAATYLTLLLAAHILGRP